MKIVALQTLMLLYNDVVSFQQLTQSPIYKNWFAESGAGRQLKTMTIMEECFGQVTTCLDGCYYKFVHRDCKGQEDFIKPNIIGSGSQEVATGDYKFLVSFRKSREDEFEVPIEGCRKHFYGRKLIWNDIVLAPAHCLEGLLDHAFSPLPTFNQKIWATRADGIEEVTSYEVIIYREQ
eukprot:TRINITY_DN5046_c0_g2_i2.p1 TRINITY_DN5046_c0_g2~~TRINITY_DN5046_c0_g2_i2.p1  ORF type:complete len:178 (+),score=18.91 TRINITY_DN5046_c0_g2_i2:202-735(+)